MKMDGGLQGYSHAEYEQVGFEVPLFKISQHDNVGWEICCQG